MVDITGLYFVITDGVRARFVRPGPDSRLHTIRVVSQADLCEQGKRGTRPVRFARRLARRLNEDFAVDLFRFFVLLAPPRVLKELTAAFDGPTRASLIGSLPTDLLAVPDPDLWPHLDKWVQPACPA
jgi:hypothetical protein